MTKQRTGGMTAIGVLNIVFGSIGTLFSLLVVIGGGALAAGGAAMEAELGAEAEGVGAAAATGGGVMVLIGLVGLLCAALLGASGIGVLMLKPWGRVLSIVCGAVIVLLNIVSIVTGGFGLMALLSIVYGGLLVGLFLKEDWKAAFSGAVPPVGTVAPEQHQQAA